MSFIAILKSLGSIKAILGYIQSFAGWLSDLILKAGIKKKNAAVEAAAEELKKAGEGVLDDKARLEAKADAACKLEKLADPGSDCGS